MDIKICFRESVSSTNDWAKQMANAGAPEGTLALAETQESGRGRRGRGWSSPPGENLYMSLILRPDICPEHASRLTLVMGLSVAQAAERILGLPARIKWPNDVVLNGKKICGILTEMSASMEGVHFVVIGTGINVNSREFPPEIADKATSLARETGELQEREAVMDAVLSCFAENYRIFLETEDLSGLAEEYNRVLANRDRQVKVLDQQHPFEGTARGINRDGELLVERQDGQVTAVFAGEVSVRGLYSYV